LLALPLDSRAALARALITSLEETADENVEALWADEIRRRDQDLKDGGALALPLKKGLQDARRRLKESPIVLLDCGG